MDSKIKVKRKEKKRIAREKHEPTCGGWQRALGVILLKTIVFGVLETVSTYL
jgi:hypothetical protein